MSENLNSNDAVWTGARQTMASWTKVLETREDVPEMYRGFFEGQDLPYALLLPPIVKPYGRTTEKIVYDTADALHILERQGNQFFTKSYPYRNIFLVEMGSVLLDSWIMISGETSAGEADTATLDFNTSGARHFSRFVEKLRPEPAGAEPAQEKDKFNYLSSINFKFMNYGRNSLRGGDAVRQIILQPEIRMPRWTMFGNLFQRIVTPAHLTILTDRELITIQDVPPHRNQQKANYGGIWQYVRLDRINSITAEEQDGRLLLSIAVFPNTRIEKIFALENRGEMERLCREWAEGR